VQSCPNGPIEDLSWATNYGLTGRVFMLTSRRYDDACFSLELGPEVANIVCDHCGKSFKSVNGYLKKDDWAYSVYFATLQTGHDDIEASLTVSIGK
jgi:hypothetical protein